MGKNKMKKADKMLKDQGIDPAKVTETEKERMAKSM